MFRFTSPDTVKQPSYLVPHLVRNAVSLAKLKRALGVKLRIGKFLCKPEFLLIKRKLFFSLFDKFTRALTRNAKFLGNLRERHIIIVVKIKRVTAALGKNIAVKVKQVAYIQIFDKHSTASVLPG